MRTVLHEEHVKLKARIVDFHGWDMPIQYAGILAEHKAVRTRAGLFDLSHMGRVWVSGPDRRAYLNRILTINAAKMAHGRCRYTFLLNEQGTIIDDLIAYEDSEGDRSLLVVNASNRDKDLAWMKSQIRDTRITIDDQTLTTSLIAIQGPKSVELLRQSTDIDGSKLGYYTFTRTGPERLVSRTGYTGEDGFEVICPSSEAVALWKQLLRTGLQPVGLGARDTLRTEASMALYGNDIDDTTTPLEAGLDFALTLDKERDFVGRSVLQRQKTEGLKRRLIGFHMKSRRIPRHGYELFRGESRVGIVTSGTFSPSLDKPIGMGYVETAWAAPGTELFVGLRGTREPLEVVPMPFYKRPA